jgi:DNA invertase Pin-like site-specific DNA recombinase
MDWHPILDRTLNERLAAWSGEEGMQQFISYIRVSTTRQGESGLGLDAQRLAVLNYVNTRGELLSEVQEIESGRKGGKARPELQRALALCRAQGASLVIGKLDRLARDVRYFLEVIDDSGVDIRFADLPDVRPTTDEGRMILVSMANFAEFEARRIGTRTRAALAAAKARGVKLGISGAANLRPHLEERQSAAKEFAQRLNGQFEGFRLRRLTQREMVAELNALRVPARSGGHWSLTQVQRVLAMLGNA